MEPDLTKSVFTRWGASECPVGTEILYSGFMANEKNDQSGGGANYLCMHPHSQSPPGAEDSNHNGNLLYGTEYANTGVLDLHGGQDAACAVCERSGAVHTYVQWGRQTCSNDHLTEYAGLVMSSHHAHTKSELVCVDYARHVHSASSTSHEGAAKLFTTEMRGEAADGDKYPRFREVGCAVCSVIRRFEGAVYPRWGARSCPIGAKKLYEGFIASSHYAHIGGGINYLCMHPEPQFPEGASDTPNGGSWLYGTEYEVTGNLDQNADEDAACVMCQRPRSRQTYVQWGRQACSNGHRTEYAGLVMGSHFNNKRSEHLCVDYERAAHDSSSSANHEGARLFTTDMRSGAAEETAYPPRYEVGCAVCSVTEGEGAVYPRWGARSCPEGASRLYEGFMAGGKFDHSGGGANFLCMHPQPQLPVNATNADNNGNRLYGTEYENTGTLDLNQHQDAACAMCQASASVAVYVQWGRQTCSNGHVTQYAGLVMGSNHVHKKTEHVCVDFARAFHAHSSSSREAAARLYTTEFEGGASNEVQYPSDREVGCAVCSIRLLNYGLHAGSVGRCAIQASTTLEANQASWSLSGSVPTGPADPSSSQFVTST